MTASSHDPLPEEGALRVAVVGGGICGLALAHRLLGRADVTVDEAAPVAGGHVRTVRDQGFLVEAGPNGFLDRFPGALALARELRLEDELVPARAAARRRYIVRGRRLLRVPDSPPTLLASHALSAAGKLRLLLEPWAAAPPAEREESVHEFASRRVGIEVADTLVDTAVSGITAGDSRRLSLPAAFPLMSAMEREHGSLLLAFARRRRAGVGPPRLVTFRHGMGQLVDGLVRALGPRLRVASAVERVVPATGGRRFSLVRSDGTKEDADRVVLAVPAHVAARLTRNLAPSLPEALLTTPFAGLAVVALGYRTEDVPRSLEGYGYLVPRSEGRSTLGVTWESSLFEGRAPAGHILLRVLLGGTRDPELVFRPETERIKLARAEVARVLGVTSAPVATWSFAWPRAIAQYELGHRERVARARAEAAEHDGLSLCGTSYDGLSFGAAIEAGRGHADAILAGAAR